MAKQYSLIIDEHQLRVLTGAILDRKVKCDQSEHPYNEMGNHLLMRLKDLPCAAKHVSSPIDIRFYK